VLTDTMGLIEEAPDTKSLPQFKVIIMFTTIAAATVHILQK
jgi:hypothetical protein